jgi:hypothetical protein
MSDLNSMIESWRRSFADLSATQLDELEDHLREQITALTTSGLSEREAFTVSAMRCGKPMELSYEFEQSDPAAVWSGRVRWMIVGFLVCAIGNAKLSIISQLFGGMLITHGVSTSLCIALQLLLLSALIAVAALVWHAWLRHHPRLVEKQPPRWLTSGWSLAVLLAVVPWLISVVSTLCMGYLLRMVSANGLGRIALSSQVTWLVMPFTTPLILLIIAVSLSRRRSRMRPGLD